MKVKIRGDALKALRGRRKWNQQQLSDATRGRLTVSVPTIKRVEGKGENLYLANARTAEGLAQALGVPVEALSQVPTGVEEAENELRKHGYHTLRTMIDAEAALAYRMVQHFYGISIRSQVLMAPLFAALLAEGSLAWRRKRVAEIEDAAAKLSSLGGGHFSFAYAACRAEDGAEAERKSIEMSDLFGRHAPEEAYNFGYDPSENNPFVDYLKEFTQQIESKNVSFETDDYGWKTEEGLPHYRIGKEVIESFTGLDMCAEYALLRGHVRIKDVPKELLADEREGERIGWIVSRIPPEELAELKEKQERYQKLAAEIGLSTDSA
jgi:transcriptional regulator with XRE-family HTH domain